MKITKRHLRRIINEEKAKLLTERRDPTEADISRFDQIIGEVDELRREALDITTSAFGHEGSNYQRAYRGWNANIEKSLATDSQWVGGMMMDTMEQTLQSLRNNWEDFSDDGEY